MELRKVKVRIQDGGNYMMDGKNVFVEPTFLEGFFHEWEQYQDGDFARKKAIVELHNGTVVRCDVEEIIFLKQ